MNVLIFPAGTEIGHEIWQSLRYCKEVTLFTAGEDYENHAIFYTEKYDILPSVHQCGWQEKLEKYIKDKQINYIFPAHDDVLVALAKYRDKFSAIVLAPTTATCLLTRSKRATYHELADSVVVPTIYNNSNEILQWPIFIKPDCGQGAQGAHRVNSPDELTVMLKKIPDVIICEYLPGDEFTVDCFSDRDRGLLFCQARTRERIRNGIAMASELVQLDDVRSLAEKISDKLSLYGAWFFQLKRNAHGILTLLEVAPRIAGTMALNRALGINFALLTLYESQRLDISTLTLPGALKISRGLVNRFKTEIHYQTVYIDFDDTVVFGDKLCLAVINFIYQCVNEHKPIHLITRHNGDIYAALKRWRLSEVFDSIIHLRHGEKKSDYIKSLDSIFIDDSFSERIDVQQCCDIPTFDLSMLDLLVRD